MYLFNVGQCSPLNECKARKVFKKQSGQPFKRYTVFSHNLTFHSLIRNIKELIKIYCLEVIYRVKFLFIIQILQGM